MLTTRSSSISASCRSGMLTTTRRTAADRPGRGASAASAGAANAAVSAAIVTAASHARRFVPMSSSRRRRTREQRQVHSLTDWSNATYTFRATRNPCAGVDARVRASTSVPQRSGNGGRGGKAIDAYRKSLELYPDGASSRNNVALLYLQLERYD